MRNGTKDLLTGLAGIAALAGLATLLRSLDPPDRRVAVA